MKKILSFFTAFLLTMMFCVPVFAASHPDRVVDDADLLSNSEVRRLTELVDEISEKYNCDVVIVTVDSLGNQSATAFADDYFDYNGYGQGKNYDGILFLISMEDRDWAITTCGFGIKAFTDAGQDYIMEQIWDDLHEGDYYDAFTTFAELSGDFLNQARNGRPYDIGNMPKGSFPLATNILIALGAGFIISLIINLANRSQLKSVAPRNAAVDYVVPGSLHVTQEREMYLYRNVTKVKKSNESGGGSSTHTSSSGRSHGGSSGKF